MCEKLIDMFKISAPHRNFANVLHISSFIIVQTKLFEESGGNSSAVINQCWRFLSSDYSGTAFSNTQALRGFYVKQKLHVNFCHQQACTQSLNDKNVKKFVIKPSWQTSIPAHPKTEARMWKALLCSLCSAVRNIGNITRMCKYSCTK